MYSLTVADHVMIAHSFKGEEFSPRPAGARRHLRGGGGIPRPRLDRLNLLIDIVAAKAELRRILDTFDYWNLDELPQFRGINTTTEYMCKHIHDLLAAALREGRLGEGGKAVTSLKVLLRENPLAWAAYDAPV